MGPIYFSSSSIGTMRILVQSTAGLILGSAVAASLFFPVKNDMRVRAVAAASEINKVAGFVRSSFPPSSSLRE